MANRNDGAAQDVRNWWNHHSFYDHEIVVKLIKKVKQDIKGRDLQTRWPTE